MARCLVCLLPCRIVDPVSFDKILTPFCGIEFYFKKIKDHVPFHILIEVLPPVEA